jgi:putative membrane protein
MLATVIIALMAGAIESIGALTGIPFGPFSYTPRIGQFLFYPLPWAVPMLWLVAILNARGVARLALRPWRKSRTYGFRVIGLTTPLVVLFDLCLEPFASMVKHFWVWSPTKLPLAWYGAPIVNFLGWGVSALLILAFVTPSLVNKQPVKHPPDYSPLIIWAGMSLLFLSGVTTRHLWPAAVVTLAQAILVTTFALRGAWW